MGSGVDEAPGAESTQKPGELAPYTPPTRVPTPSTADGSPVLGQLSRTATPEQWGHHLAMQECLRTSTAPRPPPKRQDLPPQFRRRDLWRASEPSGPVPYEPELAPTRSLPHLPQSEEASGQMVGTGNLPLPRASRKPTSPPLQLSAPTVKPHNSWRTYLQWVPNADNEEGEHACSYAVHVRKDGSEHLMMLTDLGPAPHVQIDGLENGETYQFQVCAQNLHGSGPWSEWSRSYTVPSAPHATTEGVQRPAAFSDTGTSTVIEWDEPCGQGAPITGYRVQYTMDPHNLKEAETITTMAQKNSLVVSDLEPNCVYYFRTCALNEVGESDWTGWSEGVAMRAAEPEAPSAPELLDAKITELHIQWHPPTVSSFDISKYEVRLSHSETMEGFVLLPALENGKCDLQVKYLTPNTNYYAQVRAESEAGRSGWSKVGGPFQTLQLVPERCEKLRVVDNSIGSVSLSWEAPDSCGLPLLNYELRWSMSPDMAPLLDSIDIQAGGDDQAGTVVMGPPLSVRPGIVLYFEVKASSRAGSGPWSARTSPLRTSPDVPEQPPPPKCDVRTTASIMVFTICQIDDRGDPVSRYELRYDTTPEMLKPMLCQGAMREVPNGEDAAKKYEYPVTGLQTRGPYFFSTRAFNIAGASKWSEPSEGFLLKVGDPAQMASPIFISADSTSSLSIHYTLSADLGVCVGGAILRYEFRYSRWPELLATKGDHPDAKCIEVGTGVDDLERGVKNKVFHLWTLPPPPPQTPEIIQLTGLATYWDYFAQVRAVSDQGAGPWSNLSDKLVTLPAHPDKPSPVTQVGDADNPFSIRVRMTLPRSNGRPITTCKLRVRKPEGSEEAIEWRDLESLDTLDVDVEKAQVLDDEMNDGTLMWQESWCYAVLHLLMGSDYQFSFCCINEAGESEYSDSSERMHTAPGVPQQCEVPYPPAEFGQTESSLSFVWDEPYNGGTPITNYTLEWSPDLRFRTHETVELIRNPRYVLTGLQPYKMYYVRVAAVNAVGQGKFSILNSQTNEGCFKTLGARPGPVLDITTQLSEDDNVVAHWKKPASDGGRPITKYKLIFWIDSPEKLEGEMEMKGLRHCQLPHLRPDTTYHIDILAINEVGEGPFTGTPAQVTTHPVPEENFIPPKPPINVAVALAETREKMVVTWNCPENCHKTRGFIFDRNAQTHMIHTYNVRFLAEQPSMEAATKVTEMLGIQQMRDRRTVPKDEHNVASFGDLFPGRFYWAAVQSQSDAGNSEWVIAEQPARAPAGLPDQVAEIKCVKATEYTLLIEWSRPHGNGEPCETFEIRWMEVSAPKVTLEKEKDTQLAEDAEPPTGRDSPQIIIGRETDDDGVEEPESQDFACETSSRGKPRHGESPAESETTRLSNQEQTLEESVPLAEADDEYKVRSRPASGGRAFEPVAEDLPLQDDGFVADPGPTDEEWDASSQVITLAFDNCVWEEEACRWECTGLVPGHWYAFQVRASNVVGYGKRLTSEAARTCPVAPTAPTAAHGVSGKESTTSVAFEWGPPDDTGGEPVVGYELRWHCIPYRGVVPTDPEVVLNEDDPANRSAKVTADVLAFEADGLFPAGVALPMVRCWNVVGYSPWCGLPESIDGLTSLPDIPGTLEQPPLFVQEPPCDHRPYSVGASWVTPDSGGSPIKYFEVKIARWVKGTDGSDDVEEVAKTFMYGEKSIEEDGTLEWLPGEEGSLHKLHEGLEPGEDYFVQVRAYSDLGPGKGWGPQSQPCRMPPDLPLKPPAPTSKWQWPTAIEVDWHEPEMRGAPVDACILRMSRHPEMQGASSYDITDLVNRSMKFDGLDYSTTYYFQNRVRNTVGWSVWGDISKGYMTGCCRPAPPHSLEVADVTLSRMTFSWKVGADHGAPILGFEAMLVQSPDREAFDQKIVQVNEENEENEDLLRPPPAEDVPQPLPTWAKSVLARVDVELLPDPESTTHQFGSLLAGQQYMTVVRSWNRMGWSDWSSSLEPIKMKCSAPEQCPPPQLLEASQNSMRADYRMPYDNGAAIASFEFQWIRMVGPADWHSMMKGLPRSDVEKAEGRLVVNLEPGSTPEAAPLGGIGGAGEVLIEGLEPGTEYDVRVRAINEIGAGPYSRTARMLCAPGKPDAPGVVRHTTAAASPRRTTEPPTVNFDKTNRLQCGEVLSAKSVLASPRGGLAGAISLSLRTGQPTA